jgi:hypothetical protein
MSTPNDRRASGACPGFFRRRCRDATRGGSTGYADAGYALAGAAASLLAQDYEDDELSCALVELQAALWPPSPDGLVATPDDLRVLAWFDRHLPGRMRLVPPALRGAFLTGVYRLARVEEADILAV